MIGYRPGFIYSHPLLYGLLMRALYRSWQPAIYRRVSELIPTGAEVLEVCCGTCPTARSYLLPRGIRYRGLDVNARMVEYAVRQGLAVDHCNLRELPVLPPSQVVLMMLSLFHFLPDVELVLGKLLAAARQRLIIVEPVRNWAGSRYRWPRRIAGWATGTEARFTPETLAALFARHQATRVVAAGRDMIGIWDR